VLASATAASRMGFSSASASAARARTRGSNSGDTRAPFFLNVKILNEERSTATGFPFMSATTISALRTLGRQSRAGGGGRGRGACDRRPRSVFDIECLRVKQIVSKSYSHWEGAALIGSTERGHVPDGDGVGRAAQSAPFFLDRVTDAVWQLVEGGKPRL
jgi:hypothetical protein